MNVGDRVKIKISEQLKRQYPNIDGAEGIITNVGDKKVTRRYMGIAVHFDPPYTKDDSELRDYVFFPHEIEVI